ncbi:hypothetical protein [Umezakia ovalisporum]|jgi:hypothetical protein|uniref:Uncharacterized protein n=2 Tax=Umezakia ovalisporum TaxID=75695 RepID=A0AA43H103_9CYAN|nr:hypothetical protein [Umezakia ovalisporum]MBI1241448.1 hypothetical protein [Nostoc sp. RI_552]MDH6058607.1 hypothetical protein [Umezakia ovalisporum FSS-43]MDH6064907.1 hypothetical protein [Umezakia ovalisporum FSS-62]MDH6066250.1 hypothetical protein [Umezakia ovalisporum APH033B]MDH6069530.1 hypothetical protein [Umezakia ovalisporum CobakiLakeA]
MVTAKMIQQVWSVVESTQVSTLLHFDDAALIQLLLQKFKSQQLLDTQADSSLNTYIKSKLPLIRDTAEGRLSFEKGNH